MTSTTSHSSPEKCQNGEKWRVISFRDFDVRIFYLKIRDNNYLEGLKNYEILNFTNNIQFLENFIISNVSAIY